MSQKTLDVTLDENKVTKHKGDQLTLVLSDSPSAIIACSELPIGLEPRQEDGKHLIVGSLQDEGVAEVFVTIHDNGSFSVKTFSIETLPVDFSALNELRKKMDDIDLEKHEQTEQLVTMKGIVTSFFEGDVSSALQSDVDELVKNAEDALSFVKRINQPPVIEDAFEVYPILQTDALELSRLIIGLKAYDEEDGDLTGSITFANPFDIDVLKNLKEIGEHVVVFSVRDSGGLVTTFERKIRVEKDPSVEFHIIASPVLYVGEQLDISKYVKGTIKLDVTSNEDGFDYEKMTFDAAGKHTLTLSNPYHKKDLRVTVVERPTITLKEENVLLSVGDKLSDFLEKVSPTILDHEGREIDFDIDWTEGVLSDENADDPTFVSEGTSDAYIVALQGGVEQMVMVTVLDKNSEEDLELKEQVLSELGHDIGVMEEPVDGEPEGIGNLFGDDEVASKEEVQEVQELKDFYDEHPEVGSPNLRGHLAVEAEQETPNEAVVKIAKATQEDQKFEHKPSGIPTITFGKKPVEENAGATTLDSQLEVPEPQSYDAGEHGVDADSIDAFEDDEDELPEEVQKRQKGGFLGLFKK